MGYQSALNTNMSQKKSQVNRDSYMLWDDTHDIRLSIDLYTDTDEEFYREYFCMIASDVACDHSAYIQTTSCVNASLICCSKMI
jgi:hypothetical protein